MKTPIYTRISIVVASVLALGWVVWAPSVVRVARESLALAPFARLVASVIVAHNPKSADSIKARYKDALALDTSTVLRVDVAAPVVSGADASGTAAEASIPDAASNVAPLPSLHKVRILLVPGHEPGYGGAEYGSLKERDLTVELAQDLRSLLAQDPRFEVFVTRDKQSWDPAFVSYFKTDWKEIVAWQKSARAEERARIASGSSSAPDSKVFHNSAAPNVALRLYGITKWANEHDIDIVLHIHFNDDPERGSEPMGKYAGFAIYVPVGQYANASSSRAVAGYVKDELQRYEPISSLKGESTGIVSDPALIAIGANDTADAASLLIEYAYIYEPGIVDPAKRHNTLQNMATYTYYGLQDFFHEAPGSSPRLTQ